MVDLQTVCCMCGDVGFPDKLFRCSKCHHRFQHSYAAATTTTTTNPLYLHTSSHTHTHPHICHNHHQSHTLHEISCSVLLLSIYPSKRNTTHPPPPTTASVQRNILGCPLHEPIFMIHIKGIVATTTASHRSELNSVIGAKPKRKVQDTALLQKNLRQQPPEKMSPPRPPTDPSTPATRSSNTITGKIRAAPAPPPRRERIRPAPLPRDPVPAGTSFSRMSCVDDE